MSKLDMREKEDKGGETRKSELTDIMAESSFVLS